MMPSRNAHEPRNAPKSPPRASRMNTTTMPARATRAAAMASQRRPMPGNSAGFTTWLAPVTTGQSTPTAIQSRHAARRLRSCTGPSVFQARNVAPWAPSASRANTHRVPVKDSHGVARAPVGEEWQREPPIAVEGHAAHEITKRGAEEHREQRASRHEHEVPGGAPQRVGHVAAELDGDAAPEQTPEKEEDREVEARDAGGEHPWERQE